jgi:hypothetical protein
VYVSASHDEPHVRQPLDVERLLSGESGIVAGPRARAVARIRDLVDDAALWTRLVPLRLAREARASGGGAVQVLGIYSADFAPVMARTAEELRRSGRRVELAFGALDEAAPNLRSDTVATGLRGGGKFENLNAVLERRALGDADWTLVIDDDVDLPHGFLDRFLFLAERFRLALAQPAHRRTSHAAWSVCRRERGSVLRLSRLVEIGPLVAIHRSVRDQLVPFPPLRMGWGLDLHWGGLARERGWRLGIVDAVPIRHEARETASDYDRQAAIDELRAFLGSRPHIDRETALTVVERHRDWSREDGLPSR